MAVGDPAVAAQARRLVESTSTTTSRSSRGLARRGRQAAVGAGVLVLAVTGVGAAAAAPGSPGWLSWADWLPDTAFVDGPGECPLQEMRVVGQDVSPDDPSVIAARAYLQDLDLDDVDYSAALADQQSMAVTDDEGRPTGELAVDVYPAEELEHSAFVFTISQMVSDELARQGLEDSVSIEGRGSDCTDATP